MCDFVLWQVGGGQRTTFKTLSPSNLWDPGFELGPLGLAANALDTEPYCWQNNRKYYSCSLSNTV